MSGDNGTPLQEFERRLTAVDRRVANAVEGLIEHGNILLKEHAKRLGDLEEENAEEVTLAMFAGLEGRIADLERARLRQVVPATAGGIYGNPLVHALADAELSQEDFLRPEGVAVQLVTRAPEEDAAGRARRQMDEARRGCADPSAEGIAALKRAQERFEREEAARYAGALLKGDPGVTEREFEKPDGSTLFTRGRDELLARLLPEAELTKRGKLTKRGNFHEEGREVALRERLALSRALLAENVSADGCSTGDCPHDRETECYTAMAAFLRKQSERFEAELKADDGRA